MTVPFGRQFREKYFTSFDSDIIPVNHGSYGMTPDPVFEFFINAQRNNLKYQDRHVLFEHPEEYENAVKALGEFLHTDYTNLAVVENSTTAVNTVLRSFPFDRGDRVVFLNTIYYACGNTIRFVQNRTGIEPIQVDIGYPISDDELVQKFRDAFEAEGQKPIMAVFDTITSMPGVRVPFERLAALCREYGILSLIDGAHSAGLIPIDLDAIDPDFYCSNLHKWSYVPSGCAVLYVKKEHHRVIHTFPVSHSYLDDSVELPPHLEERRLVDRFAFIGTKNLAPIATIPEAIRFRKEECGGEEKIWEYCHDLAGKAAELVSKKWGTSYLESVTVFANVEIPLDKLSFDVQKLLSNSETVLKFVHKKMIYDHKTYVPFSMNNGKVYARFSAQIYNELSDYDYASDMLLSTFQALSESELYKSFGNLDIKEK